MTTAPSQDFLNQSKLLHDRYQYGFAGKSRLTRRVEDLEAIYRDAQKLVEQVGTNRLVDEEVRSQLKERRDLYKNEIQLIREAQSQGPIAVEAAQLGTRANFQFDVYRRHFAGQNRATRDIGLLEELCETLRAILKDMEDVAERGGTSFLGGDRDIVRANLEMYENEVVAIRTARLEGTLDQRASALAAVANDQFRIYTEQFANRNRLGRRPGLIKRMVTTLERTLGEMEALQREGLEAEFNTNNQQIVRQNLQMYRTEFDAIQQLRQQSSLQDVINRLGTEANEVMSDYATHFAGKNRTVVDANKARELCDRLAEVERQMADLDRAVEHPTNQRNLSIVHDALLMYIEEHKAILEAQKAPESTDPSVLH